MWTASVNQSWASITAGASGTGVGVVTVQPGSDNPGLTTRSATLTIGSQSITINQAGNACAFTPGSTSYPIGSGGGPVSIPLTVTAGCPWSVTNNYPSAIGISSGASGTGTGSINLVMTPNFSLVTRTFTLSVADTQIAIIQDQLAVPPTITTTALPVGTVGTVYLATLAVIGGTSPYSNWAVASGSLPPGLTLNASTGAISGTPTTIAGSPFSFAVTVQDSMGIVSAAQSLKIAISAPGQSQTISFSAPGNVTLGIAPFTISATATSGLPVAFTSTTAGVCSVSGSTVTIIAVGTCSITASQQGNTTYAAAPGVVQSFTVNPAAQTITFSALPDIPLTRASISLTATASSTQPVQYVSNTTSVCTVSGSTVTILISGGCSITASQAGNTSYAAAAPVTQAFTVLFADTGVDGSVYYSAAVNLVASHGITAGCGSNNYCPTQNVTRYQMAIFMVRAAYGSDNFPYSTTPYFADVPANATGFKWIQKMFELGITGGGSNVNGVRNYCPNDTITRAQMAIFLMRARYGSAGAPDFPQRLTSPTSQPRIQPTTNGSSG